MVKLLNIARRHARSHRLHALALARTEQPLKVDRRPAALLDPAKPGQKGVSQTSKTARQSVVVLVITAPPVNTTTVYHRTWQSSGKCPSQQLPLAPTSERSEHASAAEVLSRSASLALQLSAAFRQGDAARSSQQETRLG